MASNPIDCIKLHAKYLSTDENISREAATDLALKEFEKLHGELENFKKTLNPKYKPQPFVSPDKSKRIKEIQDEYQAKIDEANTPIPEPVKAEEKPQPKVEPIEDSKESGKEPPKPPKGEEVDGEGEDSGLSGIKKGLVAKSVIDGVDLEKIGDKEMMTLGRKIIDSGEVKPEALVQKIIEEGKGVLTPSEVVALITYKADIDNGLRNTYKQANEKQEAGEDLGTLGVEIKDLERQQNDFDVMAVITANQQSMAFRLRRMMLDRDYNVVTQIEKYKKNNNGYISPEMEAKFRDLGKQLKEVKDQLAVAEKKLAEKEGQEAVDNIKESVDREKKYTEAELQDALKKERAEGRKAKKEKVHKSIDDTLAKWAKKLSADLPPGTKLNGIGIEKLFKSVGATMKAAYDVGTEISKVIKDAIDYISKQLGTTEWDSEAFAKEAEAMLKNESESKPKDKATINEDGTVSIPNQMLRDLVKRRITDINDLTDAVHGQVVKDLPDITKRQVRDYITKYGKEVNKTADEIQTQINTAKRVGRLLSELEDLQNKIKKQTNPVKKNKLTEQERELKRKIKSLEEVSGVTETLEEKNIKRLEKKLEALLSGNVTNTKEARDLSKEEKDLQDKIAEAKKNLGLVKSKKTTVDTKYGLEDLEAKEQQKIKTLEKQLEDLRDGIVKQREEKSEDSDEVKDLKEQIFEEKKKLGLIRPKVTPSTPNQLKITETEKKIQRLEKEKSDLEAGIVRQKNISNEKPSPAQQEKIDNLSDEIFDLKKNLGLIKSKEVKVEVEKVLSDEERLELAKKRVKGRISELERKIKNKDFAKPVKRLPVTDTELVELTKRKEKLQEEFDNEQYKLDLKKRTVWQKAEDVALELTSGVVRGLVASIDLSAGFVQGLWRIFSNPVRSLNAFGTMFKHLVSEKASEDYLNKWKASPIYPKLRASKLAIDDKSGKISAKEGLFISNWVNLIWDKIVSPALAIPTSIFTLGNVRKAYNISKAINPYLASQRAFDGYVNSIRINSFVALSKRIEDMGYNYESDPEVFKKAADFVNSTTGRGSLGAADASSRWLNIFLFAPRKVISEIKLFTPYAFAYYGRMPKPVRRQALLSLAKFLGSFMLTNGLMWAARKDWDDDEEDNFWNPNSSDFLTHKIGDKRLSVAGGAKSMIVFQSRFWSGKFTDQYGETTKLGERYGKPVNTRLDLVWRFILGKASPAVSVAAQKADERKGVEMDNTEAIKNLTVPIWMQDLKEMYKDSPAEVSTILTVLSFFGANARTVEPKKSSNNPSKPKIERPKPQKISRE